MPFEHGRSIVRGELDPELRKRLLEIRAERPQPGLDDKAIASWNGLALAALSEAARRLERDDWRAAAVRLAEFLLGPLSEHGRLRRSYREGKATGTGYLDDYANVAHGLYELHVATGDLRWLRSRAAWPYLPSSCSPTRSAAAFSHARRRRDARRAHERPR